MTGWARLRRYGKLDTNGVLESRFHAFDAIRQELV